MTVLGPAASALIIAAAHHDIEIASTAWARWCHGQTAQNEGPEREAGTEILPTAACRLSGAIDAKELAPATAARRSAAHRNMKLLAGVARPLAALQDLGARPVVLKGAAMLSDTLFGDLGARTLSDIDILIDPTATTPMFEAFADLGLVRWPEEIPENTIRGVMHAASFTDRSGLNLDVHWTLMHNSRCTDEDEILRLRSVPAQLGAMVVNVPDRTDLLFHALAHGKLPDHRWIVDSAYLLDPRLRPASRTLDLERLAAVASERRYLTQVRENAAILSAILPGDHVDALVAAVNAEVCRFGDILHTGMAGSNAKRTKAAFMMTINQIRGRSPREALRFVTEYPKYLSKEDSYRGVLRVLRQGQRRNRLPPAERS